MKLDTKIAKTVFGDEYELLVKEPAFAWRQLGSDDWQKQFLALCALVDLWDIERDECFSISRSLISDSSHEQVVLGALQAIGATFAGSCDEKVSSYLAGIIKLETWSNRVRGSAYLALEKIHAPAESFLGSVELEGIVDKMRTALNEIKSDSFDRIDWGWVNRF